jgi:5-methyltetrahydropteroyltriglutamate--homocysteine methyltransferase
MTAKLFPTTVIGSYPQPRWLVDHELLKAKFVPRVRARDVWRVAPDALEEAQQDATLLAIRDQEDAGIDVITDGEMRRESYSNAFATALEGIDLENPEIVQNQGFEIPLPRVVAPLRRPGAVTVEALRFLKAHTERKVRVTLPGPFTMSKQAHDDFYRDPEALAMAYADVVAEEVRDLVAAGADVVQLDEPWLRQDPEGAARFAVPAIDRALSGASARTAVHLCFGYGLVVSKEKPDAYRFLAQLGDSCVDEISVEAAQPGLDLGVLKDLAPKTILLGVIDLSSNAVESVATVAARIRRGLAFVDAPRLTPAPDCGLKYLSRAAAFGKLQNLVAAAAMVREEVGA